MATCRHQKEKESQEMTTTASKKEVVVISGLLFLTCLAPNYFKEFVDLKGFYRFPFYTYNGEAVDWYWAQFIVDVNNYVRSLIFMVIAWMAFPMVLRGEVLGINIKLDLWFLYMFYGLMLMIDFCLTMSQTMYIKEVGGFVLILLQIIFLIRYNEDGV